MDSELYDAVIKDNIDVLKQIEDRLTVEDQLTPTNNTVLHLACQHGSMNCLKEILSVHQLLLLKTNLRDETALHLAARYGHYDVVFELIAAAKSSSTMVQTMSRKQNVELETALHEAVRYNHYTVVQLLVKEDRSHRHPQNKNNETPIYLATTRGYTNIMRTILDYCESPTFGGPDGRTALHYAVLDKDGECMKLLLAHKKDLMNVSDDYGWTVYHYLAYNDLHTIVQDLVSEDKSVGYLTDKEHRRTPLHVAAYEGKLEVMKELIKYFPDSLETVDGNGQNILHIAAEKEREEVISFILSLGFETCNNLLIPKDKNGNTPLHLLAKLSDCYSELMDIREKVDWQVLDDKNFTPLDVLQMTDTQLAEQSIVRRVFNRNDIRKYWNLWGLRKKYDNEEQREIKRGKEESLKEIRELLSTQMIVAALITTVALTAGFTMPGGFDGDGSANLESTSFKTFVVTDALALLFSMSSLFLYFVLILSQSNLKVAMVLYLIVLFNSVSAVAMMLAFITAIFAVLPELPRIGATVCVISSFFILLVVSVLARGFYKYFIQVFHVILIDYMMYNVV